MTGHGQAQGSGHGHRTRGIAEHVAAIRDLIGRSRWAAREPEELELARAAGRVLAADVTAPMPLPPFDNSQMDGYAVGAADTRGPSTAGTVAMVVSTAGAAGAAGHEPAPLPGSGAAPVMTGAPIPPGADAVVPIEEALPSEFLPEGATVRLPAGQEPGRFVRRAGEDVARGQVVAPAGALLSPIALGAIAGLGLERVLVRPRLRVGILTTGDEVVEPAQEASGAQIYNANAALLRAQLERLGLEVVAARHVTDDDDGLRRLLGSESFGAPDLWVTSGGISEGAFEVVRRVLSDADGEFLHVGLQPGGPQGLAMLEGTAVVCLPGNPVSTWVSTEILLRPALAAAGAGAAEPRRLTAPAAADLERLPGRTRVLRARWDGRRAQQLGGHGSHLLATAALADALIVLEPGEGVVPAGAPVEVRLL